MDEKVTTVDGADGESRIVRLTIPAKPEYVSISRLALTGLSRVRPLADDTLADLKLALTEATSNSVRHAYANGEGRVQISFELCEDRLIVEVSDDGPGFGSQSFENRPLESQGGGGNGFREDELSEGGLGIAIIRSIADELELSTGPQGGSRLRFTKLL
ncbi:MAG: ATP-binding protein [Actinobacteria bacterium]|nr:ATP-binding protein [Actinomycetota bacterium]